MIIKYFLSFLLRISLRVALILLISYSFSIAQSKNITPPHNDNSKALNTLKDDSVNNQYIKNIFDKVSSIDTTLIKVDTKIKSLTRINNNSYEYGFAVFIGILALLLIISWVYIKIKRKKYYYRTFISVLAKHHLTFLFAIAVTLFFLSISLLLYFNQNSNIQREFFSSTGVLFSILGTILTLFGTVIGFLVYRTLRPFLSSWPSLLSKINDNFEELLNDILKKENLKYSDKLCLNDLNDEKRTSLLKYGKEYSLNILVYSPNPGQISAENTDDLVYKLFLIYKRLLKILIELDVNIRILCLTNSSISRMINELIYENSTAKNNKISNTLEFLKEIEKKYVEIWRIDKIPKTHLYLGGLKKYPDWYIRFLIRRKVKQDKHSVRGYYIEDKDELNFISVVFEEHLKDISCPLIMEDNNLSKKQKLLFYSQSFVDRLEIHWIYLNNIANKFEEKELLSSTLLDLTLNTNLHYLDNHRNIVSEANIEDLFRNTQHLHYMLIDWEVELPEEIINSAPSDTFYLRGTFYKSDRLAPNLKCEKSTLWPKLIKIEKQAKQINISFVEFV